jgi:hypothetical protein
VSTAISPLERLRDTWLAAWPTALADWSRFTKLAEPRWCFTEGDEKRESLTSSFAMIRLVDHAVVISLRQIQDLKLERFAREVLAHEIGHHVYAPADLDDNARLQARIKVALPTRESHVGMVANLYTDLIINDRLHRAAGLDMAAVYRALGSGDPSNRLWMFYMRIYEVLWSLPSGTLTPGAVDKKLDVDAGLGSRVIRTYGRDWLRGAGRFGALILPYLLEIPESETLRVKLPPWFDAEQAGVGGDIPEGFAEIDPEEAEGAVHPAEDRELSGLDDASDEEPASKRGDGTARETVGGQKNEYRDPAQYRDLLRSIGVTATDSELAIRYYRERALPFLVPFPVKEHREASDPLPEGLEAWNVGEPLAEIDWVETVVRSPHVIPGVTTVRRLVGTTEGAAPERVPLDVYVGIDCSGSMGNPRVSLSYPVLAGAVIGLSALRAGARVMVCLSGEPGKHAETDGFVRSERDILGTLTDYLGVGYSFGIERLKDTFLDRPEPKRPTHILVISDQDIFMMLDRTTNGWEIAREAAERAHGGATFVLQIDPSHYKKPVARMREIGWSVHPVRDQADLLGFARAFSRASYQP